MSRPTPGRGDLPSRAQGGRTGRPEHDHAVLEGGAHVAFGLAHGLEAQHLLAHQQVVAVLQVDGAAQAHVDAVARLERRQHPPRQAGDDARVARRQVGVLEQQVALGAADVDLVAQQVVGDAVRAVAVDDDQPEPRLLAGTSALGAGGCARGWMARRARARRGPECCRRGALLDQPIGRSVRRRCAAAIDATSGNRCSTSRVPQYWQNSTSPAFRFPQRPHLIM